MRNRSTDVYVSRLAVTLRPADFAGTDMTRRKRAGKVCSYCCASLPRPHSWGEKYCERCPPPEARGVCMSFTFRGDDWHCSFRDAGAGSPLPVHLALRDAGRLYLAAEHGRGIIDSEAKQAFFRAVDAGQGDIRLTLTVEQYQALFTAGSRCNAKPESR
jgi:hypothetical protein